MFWYLFVCGWGVTTAVITLVWIHSEPGRYLLHGLGLGLLGGALWPVTFWAAIGAAFYTRATARSRSNYLGAVETTTQLEQADAFARQAEVEGMPSSAEYWRAEKQRLTAQQNLDHAPAAHPAATSVIVLGCTIAALATIGGLLVVAPTGASADTTIAAAPSTTSGPLPSRTFSAPTPASTPTTASNRTEHGNVPKSFGEVAGIASPDGKQIADFVVNAPTRASCKSTLLTQKPANGRFIQLPVSLKTYDDADNQLFLLGLGSGSWEYIGADGRSIAATTPAAAMCSYDVPLRIGPNRSYDFTVTLDVPSEPGFLVLNSNFDGGWEWRYQGA